MVVEEYLRVAELKAKIEELITGFGKVSFIYEYEAKDQLTELKLITVNPKHSQSFLFHTTQGRDKIEALENMYAYAKNNHASENTYTIQWSLQDDNELHTSYFRGRTILEAIEKLHYGRNATKVTIFSVVLNPIS